MGRPFQLGKKVKKETKEVIKNKFKNNISRTFLIFITCENKIDIIVKSKYQKTPCPIWGEPKKETLGLSLKKLVKIPNIAIKKGITISAWLNLIISSLYKRILIHW